MEEKEKLPGDYIDEMVKMKNLEKIANNAIVQVHCSWTRPEYKMPKPREELYIVIFSGEHNNMHYDHAIATAWYDDKYGWMIESNPNIDEPEVHYWMDLPIPKDMEVK